jgi:hypothetical protein
MFVIEIVEVILIDGVGAGVGYKEEQQQPN